MQFGRHARLEFELDSLSIGVHWTRQAIGNREMLGHDPCDRRSELRTKLFQGNPGDRFPLRKEAISEQRLQQCEASQRLWTQPRRTLIDVNPRDHVAGHDEAISIRELGYPPRIAEHR